MLTCKRCNRAFIDEELSDHICTPNILTVQEIGIDFVFEGETNQNGDKVYIAQGLNGILYRLIQCDHNPPHPDTRPTVFDTNKNRRELYRTMVNYGIHVNCYTNRRVTRTKQPKTKQNLISVPFVWSPKASL